MSNINALAGLLDLFTAQGRRGRGLLTDGGLRVVRTKAPVIVDTMPPIEFVRPSVSQPGTDTPTAEANRTPDTELLHKLKSPPSQTVTPASPTAIELSPIVLPPEPPTRRRRLVFDPEGNLITEPVIEANQDAVPRWYHQVEESRANGQSSTHLQSGTSSTKPSQAAKV